MKMIFATNNKNKLRELREIFNDDKIKSLEEADINVDIEETGKTFYKNALIKAKAIYNIAHEPVIADDSGLVFDELKDWPGIYTHRIEEDAKKLGLSRNEYLINKGKELDNKKITAICTLVYYDGKKIIRTTGKMHGTITTHEYPGNGFGFDSVFRLNDGKVVSSLSPKEKNLLSHRYKASVKLKEKLQKKNS
jgi:XTP/dITP diphosphohydrolase